MFQAAVRDNQRREQAKVNAEKRRAAKALRGPQGAVPDALKGESVDDANSRKVVVPSDEAFQEEMGKMLARRRSYVDANL